MEMLAAAEIWWIRMDFDWASAEQQGARYRVSTVFSRPPVFNPKLAYTATKTANQLLTEYNFARRIDDGKSEDWVLEFKDAEGRLTVTAWTTGEDHDFLIPLAPETYEVTSYLGGKLPALIAGPDGLTIQLTDVPRYLRPRAESANTTSSSTTISPISDHPDR